MVVRRLRFSRIFFRRLLFGVEHVRNARSVPGLPSPMALDIVSFLRRLVSARRLVCGRKRLAETEKGKRFLLKSLPFYHFLLRGKGQNFRLIVYRDSLRAKHVTFSRNSESISFRSGDGFKHKIAETVGSGRAFIALLVG